MSKPSLDLILSCIVSQPTLHVAWLNSLSHLEYCGAQKIALYAQTLKIKSPVLLQHLAEEFRHAYFFKKQAENLIKQHKIEESFRDILLIARVGKRYLQLLDLQISRIFRQYAMSTSEIRQASYLMTTYAIELRALNLYLKYDALLKQNLMDNFRLSSVLKEESSHLQSIEKEIKNHPPLMQAQSDIFSIEARIYEGFLQEIEGVLPLRVTQAGISR